MASSMYNNNPRPAFRITNGKGFAITLPNGYTVSVQFGASNYCENQDYSMIGNYEERDRQYGAEGCMDAETALIDAYGNFVRYKGDHVQARQTAFDVMALLNYAMNLNKAI